MSPWPQAGARLLRSGWPPKQSGPWTQTCPKWWPIPWHRDGLQWFKKPQASTQTLGIIGPWTQTCPQLQPRHEYHHGTSWLQKPLRSVVWPSDPHLASDNFPDTKYLHGVQWYKEPPISIQMLTVVGRAMDQDMALCHSMGIEVTMAPSGSTSHPN